MREETVPLLIYPCPDLDGGEWGVATLFLGLFAVFLFMDLAVNARAMYVAMTYTPSYRVRLDAFA